MSVSLGEGNTPLIRSRAIGPAAGLRNLFFKLEAVNPTGSYKDRYAAAAISHMVAAGQKNCIATSSGNTGAALAAAGHRMRGLLWHEDGAGDPRTEAGPVPAAGGGGRGRGGGGPGALQQHARGHTPPHRAEIPREGQGRSGDNQMAGLLSDYGEI